MALVGPDGRPLNTKAAVQMSERNTEEKALQAAEFKMFVHGWTTFREAKTINEAINTMRGQELIKQGMKEDGVERLYTATQAANELVNDFPERDIFMVQVIESILAIMSGNPRILNTPQFVATVCCSSTGIFTPMSSKEKTHE